MSKKFKVWLDSGANINSSYEQVVSLEEFGLSDEDWALMDANAKDGVMREAAWERMDWGYEEIEGDEE